ncbi:hypothetical protein RJ640_007261 [Escallonia rubra]|uniref:Pectinesterase inhibitor domain-containing protein n=1 Tax=Escallonia rubra TaxID=112253 RepID=A0AA88UB13_9ASTE|nr:hypothetical protein RJ640_007261 [Escallonia rubra]
MAYYPRVSSSLRSVFFHVAISFIGLVSCTIVTDLCSKAQDPNFCTDALASDPRAATADLKGLGQISIDLSTANATDTLHKLRVLIKFVKDKEVRKRLTICKVFYNQCIETLKKTSDDLKTGGYQDMKTYALFSYYAMKNCEKVLAQNQPPINVNPLADANLNLELLTNIVVTATIMVVATCDPKVLASFGRRGCGETVASKVAIGGGRGWKIR